MNKNSDSGPPNLDELLAKFINKFTSKAKLSTPGNSSLPDDNSDAAILGLLLLAVVFLWVVSGIFIVSPAERAVVLRFGQYNRVLGSGIHWIPSLIDTKSIVNVQRIGTLSYKSEMLTKDENIVYVSLSVQYRVDDPKAFLFNLTNPIASLEQATASALRQVVGRTPLDAILTTGREQVRQEVAEQLNAILAPYHAGLTIMDVTLQPAQPPEQVTAAFDDAINAREDEQRYINQAQTYAEKVIPIAQGQAARIHQAALADKEQTILQARGTVQGYLALLPEYEKAPQVTRKRLYMDTMESILTKTNKVIVDSKANNILYLPLDKLVSSSPSSPVVNLENEAPPMTHKEEDTKKEIFSGRKSYSDESVNSNAKREQHHDAS